MDTRLAASLVIHNELSRYLPLVVDHLRGFCDQIIVLDDGSDDGTADWLREHADEQMQVTCSDQHSGHHGQIRQHLLELVAATDATHCLAIDADEFVEKPLQLRARLEHEPDVPVWTLDIAEVWNPTPQGLQLRMDGGWRTHPLRMLWKTPPALTGNWKIRDMALACRRSPIAIDSLACGTLPIKHLHFGWANKTERKARYDRYMRLDKGRFHARSHLASIVWPDSKMRFEMMPWPEGDEFKMLRERLTGAVASAT